MQYRLAVVCLLGMLSPAVHAGDVAIRLTGKWLKMSQEFESKSLKAGEFSEVKRDARLRYELRAEGFLSVFNQDKEYSDNKVLGVDLEGTSEGFLEEEQGKYYWRLLREWKNRDGNDTKINRKWEVTFVSGDWKDFEAGRDVELALTKSAQEDWNSFHTELVTKYAEDLRATYVKQYPKVTVHPVQQESLGHKTPVRFVGNADKMVITGSDSFLVAKVVVSM